MRSNLPSFIVQSTPTFRRGRRSTKNGAGTIASPSPLFKFFRVKKSRNILLVPADTGSKLTQHASAEMTSRLQQAQATMNANRLKRQVREVRVDDPQPCSIMERCRQQERDYHLVLGR